VAHRKPPARRHPLAIRCSNATRTFAVAAGAYDVATTIAGDGRHPSAQEAALRAVVDR